MSHFCVPPFGTGSYTDIDNIYWTAQYILDRTLYMRNTFVFTQYGLFGGATCDVSVWNDGLAELTMSVHYLHCVLD